jgi:hypothetical protein
MVFPIAGGTQDTSYEIENSLRFNDDDSARLSREFTQDPTSRKTFTISIWVKRSNLGANTTFFNASTTNNFYDQALMFDSNDTLRTINVASGSDAIQVITNRKFRDVSAWYHIVLAVDTTEAAVADGVKFYINGVQETSFSTTTYSQNATYELGRNGSTTAIGRQQLNGTQYFDGYMAEINYIDGQQLTPTYFGETNDNGVWVPKEYTGTYGNNGFYLEFKQTGTSANSSGIGADTSGNDEHFTPTNLAAIDVTTDTPTNNFATFNSIEISGGTFSEGNLRHVTSGTDLDAAVSTIALTGAKWYAEFKAISKTGNYYNFGVTSNATNMNDNGVTYRSDGKIYQNGNQQQSSLATIADNDIVSVMYDTSNGNVTFKKNGTDVGSAVAIPDTTRSVFFKSGGNGGTNTTAEANFGNAPFSISSGNADANGYGNFEYAVPSGHYALCTKNLAEYG